MSEEIGGTSPQTEAPTPTGQSDSAPVTSDAEVSSTPAVQESAPVETPKAAKPKSKKETVNLFESEEFRRYQATQARQIREAQERADALAAQIRDQQLKGMNDYEKAQFAAKEAQQKAASLEEQLRLRNLEDLKRQDMVRLNQKTGIPLDMLEGATSYEEAQEMAMAYLEEKLESTVEERVAAALEAKRANRTDTGGGKPAPVLTQRDERLQAAKDSNDASAYVAALFSEG